MPSKVDKYSKKELLEQLAKLKGLIAGEGQFKLENYLFDKQLQFVQDPAKFKLGVTTRRAGKSISCVTDLTHTAISDDNVTVLYITLSRKNAKRLVWPEFKKLNKLFNLQGNINESDLSITWPNGSTLYLLGANDRTSIEDFRGLAVKKVYLDESQSFPDYIRELIDDVLGPALMDHDGQLVLIGTPGPIPSGYFYELTKNPHWKLHHWSFFDNPKLPFLKSGITHQAMLERELTRRGVGVTDPSIQREWFGKWIVDSDSLVYHYNAKMNDYETLPEGEYTYILGVDLGYEDADALAVICYGGHSPVTYVVEEEITRHQDLTQLTGQIDKLIAKYPISRVVVDTGGLGKKIAEEISKRYEIPMLPAEKSRKVEYIELMNDALRTGKLKIKANSQFAQDAMKVEWDHDKSTPDRKIISSRFHSDICEAVLYAWRESYSYTYKYKAPAPEYGTKAWSEKEESKMFAMELERLENEKALSEGFTDHELGITEEDLDKLHSIDRPTLRYSSRFNKKRTP